MKCAPIFILAHFFMLGCSILRSNPYENATPEELSQFKKVRLPFLPGTKFTISQGAFGHRSHAQPGKEYSWDFDVPYGTAILAVDEGIVMDVWLPKKGGGCDSKFKEDAHKVSIQHADGTVSQYVHINSDVSITEIVKAGQVIGRTEMNGWICHPQLHFDIYVSGQVFGALQRKTIPLYFEDLPQGKARESYSGSVPNK